MRPARKLSALVALGAAAAIALTGCTKKNEADTRRRIRRRGRLDLGHDVQGRVRAEAAGRALLRGDERGRQEGRGRAGQRRVALPGPDPGRRRRAGRHRALLHPAEGRHADRRAERPRLDGAAAAAGQGRRASTSRTADTDAPNSVREAFVNQATAEGIGEALTDALMKAMGGKGKYAIVSCGETAENLNSWIEVQKSYTASKYPDAADRRHRLRR